MKKQFLRNMGLFVISSTESSYSNEGIGDWVKNKITAKDHFEKEKFNSIIKRLEFILKIKKKYPTQDKIFDAISKVANYEDFIPNVYNNETDEEKIYSKYIFHVYEHIHEVIPSKSKEFSSLPEGSYESNLVILSEDEKNKIKHLIQNIEEEDGWLHNPSDKYWGHTDNENRPFNKTIDKNEIWGELKEQFEEAIDDTITHILKNVESYEHYIEQCKKLIKKNK